MVFTISSIGNGNINNSASTFNNEPRSKANTEIDCEEFNELYISSIKVTMMNNTSGVYSKIIGIKENGDEVILHKGEQMYENIYDITDYVKVRFESIAGMSGLNNTDFGNFNNFIPFMEFRLRR